MIRKMIPVFTAAAISMSITFVVPVAITAVSSVAFSTEAQALSLGSVKNSVKKAAKKTKRVVKRKAKIVNEQLTWKGLKDLPGDIVYANKEVGKGAYKYTKRGVKKTVFSAKGAGKLAWSDVKRVGSRIPKGRIGDLPNIHDHRQKPPSGVAITYNPLRWR